ncbi:uncharacterized protein LOC143188394 [Calliopsis andreniformis]|uniref:uncharacterized protein LOC143188394 n=1 Tax=Calliopsis andreniformis TaxID=337506 RepID=UPI003FCEDA71
MGKLIQSLLLFFVVRLHSSVETRIARGLITRDQLSRNYVSRQPPHFSRNTRKSHRSISCQPASKDLSSRDQGRVPRSFADCQGSHVTDTPSVKCHVAPKWTESVTRTPFIMSLNTVALTEAAKLKETALEARPTSQAFLLPSPMDFLRLFSRLSRWHCVVCEASRVRVGPNVKLPT